METGVGVHYLFFTIRKLDNAVAAACVEKGKERTALMVKKLGSPALVGGALFSLLIPTVALAQDHGRSGRNSGGGGGRGFSGGGDYNGGGEGKMEILGNLDNGPLNMLSGGGCP